MNGRRGSMSGHDFMNQEQIDDKVVFDSDSEAKEYSLSSLPNDEFKKVIDKLLKGSSKGKLDLVFSDGKEVTIKKPQPMEFGLFYEIDGVHSVKETAYTLYEYIQTIKTVIR